MTTNQDTSLKNKGLLPSADENLLKEKALEYLPHCGNLVACIDNPTIQEAWKDKSRRNKF